MAAAGADVVARYRAARRDPTLVVLEGFHALKHALRFGAEIVDARALDPGALATLADQLAPDVVPWLQEVTTACPASSFRELVPSPPSTGVVALARRPAAASAVWAARDPRPLVVLEAPQHLGNVGAVVRVAAAADAAGVMVLGGIDPFHPTCVRGGAGLQFALACARLDALPPSDRPAVALAAGGVPLPRAGLPPGALPLVGTEREGLSAELRAQAALTYSIPMRAGVSSLNLATAVAIALYAGFAGA